MPELKPCPFCGGEGDWYEVKPGYGYVSCDTCDATIGCFDALPKQDAIDAWNTRAVEVVRCRDCAYYEDTGNCTLHYLADGCLGEVEPNGFCKWGERK